MGHAIHQREGVCDWGRGPLASVGVGFRDASSSSPVSYHGGLESVLDICMGMVAEVVETGCTV